MNRNLVTIFIIFSSLLLITAETKAEPESKENNLAKGFNLGLSISELVTDGDSLDNVQADHLIRPTFGIYRDLWKWGKFSMRGGVNYGLRGARINGGRYRNMLHYLDAPVNFRYELFSFLDIYAGAKPSFRFLAHQYDNEKSSTLSNYEDLPNSHNYDLNISGGIEMEINEYLGMFFNYSRGLNAVNEDDSEGLFHSTFELGFNIDLSDRTFTSLFVDEADTMARHHIAQLSDGILLVRLQDREGTIRELEEREMFEEIEELKQRTETTNRKIIDAFEHYFDFTEVMFFYSSNSNEIKVRNFDNVFPADDEEENGNYLIGDKPFYIAEFGSVDQNHGIGSLEGLIIKNEYFASLRRPFPFYVMENQPASQQERTIDEMVEIMNERLHDYYQQHHED